MRGLLAGLAVLGAGAAQAQQVDCARATVQIEMNYCAQQAWQRADDDLNALWGIVKPRADAAGWGKRLLQEQRVWLGTRDARCAAERADYDGGSIAPQVYWTCMEEMTLRRNADFRAMM